MLGNHDVIMTSVFETEDEFLHIIDIATSIEKLEIFRPVLTSENNINIFTTDTTLGGMITTLDGRMPKISGEFISNSITNENSQVGIFGEILPSYNISVFHISSLYNFGLSGDIHISFDNIYSFYKFYEILSTLSLYDRSYFWNFNQSNTSGILRGLFIHVSLSQVMFFLLLYIVLLLFILVILASYGVSQLKEIVLYTIHGNSKIFVAFSILKKISPTFLLSSLVSFFLINIYINYFGFSYYTLEINIALLIVAIFFSLLCIIFLILFLIGYTHYINKIEIIKGKYPYKSLQTLKIIIKTACIIIILIVLGEIESNINILNMRRDAVSNWTLARDIHRIEIADRGQLLNFHTEEQMYETLGDLIYDLKTYHNGFIIYSGRTRSFRNFHFSANERPAHSYITIDVSPNYFILNPIYSIDGLNVTEYLVFDEYTINVIVPFSMIEYKELILYDFRDLLYFQKISVPNFYNSEFDRKLYFIEPEKLSVNIIWANNNQEYFLFSSTNRVEYGNTLIDAIAFVYTGNFHLSYSYARLTSSFFIQSYATNTFSEIQSVFSDNNLGSILHSLTPIYDAFGAEINLLQESMLRNIFLIVASISLYFVVTFSFFKVLIEKSIKKLSLKFVFGYNSLHRNKSNLVILTLINIFSISLAMLIPLVIRYVFGNFIVVRLSGNILILGVVVVLVDIIGLLSLENAEVKKHSINRLKGLEI